MEVDSTLTCTFIGVPGPMFAGRRLLVVPYTPNRGYTWGVTFDNDQCKFTFILLISCLSTGSIYATILCGFSFNFWFIYVCVYVYMYLCIVKPFKG